MRFIILFVFASKLASGKTGSVVLANTSPSPNFFLIDFVLDLFDVQREVYDSVPHQLLELFVLHLKLEILLGVFYPISELGLIFFGVTLRQY